MDTVEAILLGAVIGSVITTVFSWLYTWFLQRQQAKNKFKDDLRYAQEKAAHELHQLRTKVLLDHKRRMEKSGYTDGILPESVKFAIDISCMSGEDFLEKTQIV